MTTTAAISRVEEGAYVMRRAYAVHHPPRLLLRRPLPRIGTALAAPAICGILVSGHWQPTRTMQLPVPTAGTFFES
ncbi:hypothetical protein AB0C34_23760 [Nocardia sp. NPDC049220]|uniref:hypothetical protein n=1 Tax=Nocardia sp. NPDC049220 TaxID=3155273 RepID=UPI0033FCCE03